MDPAPVNGPDALRPTEQQVAAAWATRVRAARDQVERCREVDDDADFYRPHAKRFARNPHRLDEPALDILRSLVRSGDTWLDIGAGGGRYALPLALQARRVHAIDPSPSMLVVLREGMSRYGIGNIEIHEGRWPFRDAARPSGDAALMAHIGYDIEDISAFYDAAEAAVSRHCVAIMRTGVGSSPSQLLWQEIHGEERVRLPTLPELLLLLLARGSTPEVTIRPRAMFGYESREALLASARQMLWLRPGSAKERSLGSLVEERASEREGVWALDWNPAPDGIATWKPRG